MSNLLIRCIYIYIPHIFTMMFIKGINTYLQYNKIQLFSDQTFRHPNLQCFNDNGDLNMKYRK